MTLRDSYYQMMRQRYRVPAAKLKGKTIKQMGAMATRIEKKTPSTGIYFKKRR